VHFSRKNCLEYCETEAYNSGRVEGHAGEGHVLMTLGITKSAFTICIFNIVLYFGRIAGFLHSRHKGAGEVLCCGIIKDFYDLKLISLCSAAVLSWISMISEGDFLSSSAVLPRISMISHMIAFTMIIML
jgi:hypothetical protein